MAQSLGWSLAALSELPPAVTLLTLLWQSRQLPFEPDIGTVLAKHNMATDTLSTSHMLDLSYASFAALRLPAALAAIALLIAPAVSFFLRLRRQALRCNLDVGLGDGCVSGGGPYRFGTFWTIPFVQGSGQQNRRASSSPEIAS